MAETTKAAYEQNLEEGEQESTPASPTFPSFPNLPTEIRHLIWLFTLPGRRTLVVSPPTKTHDLSFLQKNNHPAPVALFTCQESREIALKSYRLVFDHPNQFANLPGGDILYFGPECRWKTIWKRVSGGADTWKCHRITVVSNLTATCVRDLEQVRHLAFFHLTRALFCRSAIEAPDFPLLKRDVLNRARRHGTAAGYKSLETLYVVDDPRKLRLAGGRLELERMEVGDNAKEFKERQGFKYDELEDVGKEGEYEVRVAVANRKKFLTSATGDH